MKEILKYLRSINSYSQEKVAESIGLSRQSYNKYESGSVVPSDKIVFRLAEFYKVDVDFIKANKIPDLPKSAVNTQSKLEVSYENSYTKNESYVASAEPSYASQKCENSSLVLPIKSAKRKINTYEAYLKDDEIHIIGSNFPFKEGQKLKVTIEEESEEEKFARKQAAWKKIEEMIGKFKFPEEFKNLSYDEIKDMALEEKYGAF